MPTPVQEAQYRRDWARWRTRRLSWLIGGGAATASVMLGALFAQLLPGHSAPASGGSPAGQPAGAPASGGGTAAPGQQAQTQAPAPAPAQAPPQVVSGGS